MVFFAAATWLANTKDAASQTRGRALQGTRLPAHSKRQRGKGQAECKRFDLSFRRSRQVAEREPAISMPLSEPQMLAARARTTVAEARENCNPKMLLLRAHLVVLLGCRKKHAPVWKKKERKRSCQSGHAWKLGNTSRSGWINATCSTGGVRRTFAIVAFVSCTIPP